MRFKKNLTSKYIEDYTIEDYINQKNENLSYLAHNSKKFIRFDSARFKNLIDELKTGNSSYVTYLGNFLAENKEINLNYLSVMLKESNINRSFNLCFNEILGSRMANFMNYPVVYNEQIIDESDSRKLLSVDFVQPGQRLTDMEDFSGFCYNLSRIKDLLEITENMMKKNSENIEITVQNFNDLKSDLVKMFLYRKIILCDDDFGLCNIPVLINDNNYVSIGPNMDMEYAFYSRLKNEDVSESYNYCIQNCPEIWEDFVEKYRQLMSKNNYKKIIRSIGCGLLEKIDFTNFMENNYQIFNEVMATKQQSQDLSVDVI